MGYLLEITSLKPRHKIHFYAPKAINIPYAAWYGLKVERINVNFKNRKFLVYINSHCCKIREDLFRLIKNKNNTAEALGKCSITNNKRAQGNFYNLDQIYAQYNFGFAMENSFKPGYITEKIVNIFRAGAIPIYWGDTDTVEKYFNPKAFINVKNFNSLEDAANYIVNLNNDPDKMQEMRSQPIFKNDIIPEDFTDVAIDKASILLREAYFEHLTRNN